MAGSNGSPSAGARTAETQIADYACSISGTILDLDGEFNSPPSPPRHTSAPRAAGETSTASAQSLVRMAFSNSERNAGAGVIAPIRFVSRSMYTRSMSGAAILQVSPRVSRPPGKALVLGLVTGTCP